MHTLSRCPDAAMNSATGIDVYSDKMARLASNLDNQQTPGFMEVVRAEVTAGISGTSVRNVDIKDYEARGGLLGTERALDISAGGRNKFLIVRNTDGIGYKTTGHFTVDKNGFLVDEAGNFLMGASLEAGPLAPLNLSLDSLQPIKIPMSPTKVKETTRVFMEGQLPAAPAIRNEAILNNAPNLENFLNHVSTNSTVYDSLGAPHDLAFNWTRDPDIPLVWRLNISDNNGSLLYKNAVAPGPDNVWDATPNAGIYVSFDNNGELIGVGDPATVGVGAALSNFKDAQAELNAARDMIQHLETLSAQPIADIQAAMQQYYTDKFQGESGDAGAAAVNAQIAAAADYAAALNDSIQNVIQGGAAQAGSNAKMEATKTLFSATLTEAFPNLVAEWNNNVTSTITLESFPGLKCLGDMYHMPTLRQDGSGNTHFTGVTISDSGRVLMNFTDQNRGDPVAAIILSSFRNTNGLTQGNDNVLYETEDCGQQTLTDPLGFNGEVLSGVVYNSNVNPTKTMVTYNRASDAVSYCATAYKVAEKTTDFVLAAFA